MNQYGFRLSIKQGYGDEYIRRHKEEVYPELIEAFAEFGIEEYIIFMDPRTNGIFAYIETDDIKRVFSLLEGNKANIQWQKFMSDILLPDEEGRIMTPLSEAFHFSPTPTTGL